MEHKHILVVGAGAIGGLYAAYLAKVADVVVLDTNQAHVEAIRRHGPTPIHRYSFKGLRTGYYDGDRVEEP